ncbi:Hypothetical predicted protein [Cloeon dipterum]|uniref:DNA polymerase delta subunit 3 n=1 Tax=Cloeon dipterum TaxID=197152 RepID=A0A8S1CAZ3_9INSE|nr:Hypothetical predicted protein [Cloeon dipterum]
MNDRLEELEDLVIGQDVSVSYKRVSKDFNVHVNNAKKILSTFADKHKDAVSETHLFSSKVISDVGSSFGWQFCLVHKEDVQLLNKSKKFENTSSHVYSVYQGSRSKEILADIATRSENPGESFSGIQNKNVCIRDSNSRRKFTSKVAEPPAFTKKKQEEIKKKPEEKPIETNAKAEESIKEEEKKEPQSEKDSKSKTASAINKNKRQGGIANFFQRGAAAATAKVEPKPVVKKEEGKKEEPEPKPKVEDEKKIVKQEKPAPKKGKQSSKRKSAKLDNHSEKKRKRIMIASDSESSDEGIN